jgi:hypothetical protein
MPTSDTKTANLHATRSPRNGELCGKNCCMQDATRGQRSSPAWHITCLHHAPLQCGREARNQQCNASHLEPTPCSCHTPPARHNVPCLQEEPGAAGDSTHNTFCGCVFSNHHAAAASLTALVIIKCNDTSPGSSTSNIPECALLGSLNPACHKQHARMHTGYW